jgi:Lamin Tail Domain/Bacterial Ig-like domain
MRESAIQRALVGSLLFFLFSCGGGGAPGGGISGTTPTNCSPSCIVSGNSATVEVDNNGGTITYTPDGAPAGQMMVLNIPPGAVSGVTTFTLTPSEDPASDPSILPGFVWEFTPEGQTFNPALTLTIQYDPSNLPGGVSESDLTLSTYNSTDAAWDELLSIIDTSAHTISASLDHFSRKAAKTKDTVAPTGVITPGDGAAMHGSTAIVIQFSERMKASSLVLGGSIGGEVASIVWSRTTYTNDTVTLRPASSWSEGVGRTLTVSATDAAGNVLSPGIAISLEVDDTLPVASLLPAAPATIGKSAPIVLTFNDDMAGTALLGGTMAGEAAAQKWGSISKVNDTLTITPNTYWSNGAQTLTVSADDNAGNTYVSGTLDYSVDAEAPTVSSVTPASGSVIGPNDPIVITFSEGMDENSLILSGTMTGVGQVVADGNTTAGLAWSVDGITLTLTPTSQWNSGAGQTLSCSAADNYGNGLAQLDLTYSVASGPPCSGAAVVISQVYGGGGNSGAIYQNDFIELHNRSLSNIDLTGWSIQYASPTSSVWQVAPLTGSIPAGGYYLIQAAQGGVSGSQLPASDASSTINMSVTSGKLALVDTVTALSGTCPTGLVDLLGYGSANCYEGSGAAPGGSSALSLIRAADGCTDSDDNASDFTAAAPEPRNSASTDLLCTCP